MTDELHVTGTALDTILGGGIQRGRIVELLGATNIGKTKLALDVCASVKGAVFIDCERHLSPAKLGKATAYHPTDVEDALRHLMWCVVDRFPIVVVDNINSLAATEDAEPFRARMMTGALRKVCTEAHRSGTIVIFTTRLDTISRVFGNTRNNNALKFYASARVMMMRTQENEREAVRLRAVKCKWSAPFRETSVMVAEP